MIWFGGDVNWTALGVEFDQDTGLLVDFGDVGMAEVPVVGTKFLRRVAVPIPSGASSVRFGGELEFWFSRRAWIGKREEISGRSHWSGPSESTAREFQLLPMESAELRFPVDLSGDLAFALKLRGFYEFRTD